MVNKRKVILTTAAKIIYEEGMQKLTMENIASHCEMTKGGLLYHFKSKSDLLLQMNQMVIEEYEAKIEAYQHELQGKNIYTRAYALVTLDYINNSENILFPAVFISSHEHKESKQLWDTYNEKWELEFEKDEADSEEILALRLMCDGIWFSIMYNYTYDTKEPIIQLIQKYCRLLEK